MVEGTRRRVAMTKVKSILIILLALLFFSGALLYIVFAATISPWIPTISLLYWSLRGNLGRPSSGAGWIANTLYQFANVSVVFANLAVIAGAMHLTLQGRFYQKIFTELPKYWGSHKHMMGRLAEAIVISSTILLPISAIAFAGGAITWIIKHEWYSTWKFGRAKSKLFKDLS